METQIFICTPSIQPLVFNIQTNLLWFQVNNLERHFKATHPKFNERHPPGSELQEKKN